MESLTRWYSRQMKPKAVEVSMPKADKKIYVIGHRNPDTDSVVSAAAYASLKRALGVRNCIAARAGKVTPQTEYIFNRFKVPMPEFLPDLTPKVGYYYNSRIRTIHKDTSLWKAMSLLQNVESHTLPVVDSSGRYHSLLHDSFFGQKMLRLINPKQKTTIMTSINLLASVMHAQTLVVTNEKEIKKSAVIVAAAELETFKSILHTHIKENTIVVTGDRPDVMEHAIESSVRAIIITNGYIMDKALRAKAEENGVSVLVSPFDTGSSTLLLLYSMPVGAMSDADLKALNKSDPIRTAAPLLAATPGNSLPVVNDDGKVVGVISENDLYHEARIDVIMVDHNEPSQAIGGIEHYAILEIIDHHRLGAMSTKNPITFINRPVGATCTIVAALYQENHIPMTTEMASILLSGILADTLGLQSATTTDTDRNLAEYLSNITNLDIGELARDIMNAASNISGRTAGELVLQDMKKYDEGKCSFSVSQIEVGDSNDILDRKKEFIDILTEVKGKNSYLFSALLVTNITELSSLLLLVADHDFEQYVNLPRMEDNVYAMRDVVSRKKQLMPILSEMVEKYSAG